MRLTLSRAESAALSNALAALLSPQADSAELWRESACLALKELLGADYSMYSEHTIDFSEAETKDGPLVVRAALPRLIDEMALPTLGQTMMSRLMMLERAGKVPFFTTLSLDRLLDGCFEETPFFREIMVPGEMRHIAGINSVTNDGVRRVAVGWDRRRSVTPSERTLFLLGLLHPAFEAGILNLQRASAADHLDAVLMSAANGIMLFAASGEELHRNPAMARMIQQDPESATLLAAIRSTTAAVQASQFRTSRNRTVTIIEVVPVTAMVRTKRDNYSVRARAIARSTGGQRGEILVTLSRTGASPASVGELKARFGFTNREAEVAQLLAERKTDVEIGAQLGISWHTARHHVERVFGCLGVSSRRAVADMMIAESVRIQR